MITKNYKAILGMLLCSTARSGATTVGLLPMTDVSGTTRYCNGTMGNSNNSLFPGSAEYTPTLNATGSGISVGSGSTAATENDYNLESTITSGVSLSLAAVIHGEDNDGNPYVEFHVTVTNVSNSAVTVREIGYKQTKSATDTKGATSSYSRVFLIDRSVLATEMTIPAGLSGVIVYRLTTDVSQA